MKSFCARNGFRKNTMVLFYKSCKPYMAESIKALLYLSSKIARRICKLAQ